MEKSVFKNKRAVDKRHKKLPPGKTPRIAVAVPTSTPIEDIQFAKRTIESNWCADRDLPSTDESEDEQCNAADFERLLQLPPSTGGHFFFSNEKHWQQEVENPIGTTNGGSEQNRTGDYFCVDTKLLNASLLAVPLYQRLGCHKQLFSKFERNHMLMRAEQAAGKYQQLLDAKKMSSPVPAVPVETKPKPVPCLVGKFALPADNGTDNEGSKPADVPAKTAKQPLEESIIEKVATVRLTDVPSTDDSVPIGETAKESEFFATSTEMQQRLHDAKQDPGTNQNNADIQQWLDDILDI